MQWASCKWGIDEDITRARAVQESYWRQDTQGDWRYVVNNDTTEVDKCKQQGIPVFTNSSGQYGCFESYSILQIKGTVHKGTYPASKDSTPFGADWSLAWQRTCFEGAFTWINSVQPGANYGPGDMWGCVGLWFSGRWYDTGANDYISKVKNYYNTKPWMTWESAATSTPPIIPTAVPTSIPIPTPIPTATPLSDWRNLKVSVPISLNKTTFYPGETVTGKITYQNIGTVPLTIKKLVIANRPPGGTNTGGPYLDLSPKYAALSLQPNQSVTLTASRQLTTSDPEGKWYAYGTFADSNGVYHDSASVYYTVAYPIISIYIDNLSSGWSNWSWDTNVNLSNTSTVYNGTKSISFSVTEKWGALYLHSDSGVNTTGYSALTFALQASQSNQAYTVFFKDKNNTDLTKLPLSNYGGQPTVGQWKVYRIPLSSLGATNKIVKGFILQDRKGSKQPSVYIDAISLN